jgi:hypothetical protein
MILSSSYVSPAMHASWVCLKGGLSGILCFSGGDGLIGFSSCRVLLLLSGVALLECVCQTAALMDGENW